MKGFSGFTIIVATIFSTIIHFFVLTLLDTLPLLPKEITPRMDIFMVDLISLQVANAVPPKEETKTVQTQEAVEVKKPEEKKEPKKEEKQEAQKDKVVLADRGKEQEKKEKTEKGPPNPEEQRLAAVDRVRQNFAARGEGDSPVTEAERNEYGRMIQERVNRFWVIPETMSQKDLKAVIIIEVDQKGHMVGTPRFEQSSGNSVFDEAAKRAISKAVPFPPPPGQVPSQFGLKFP